jgi:GxxExxY protein
VTDPNGANLSQIHRIWFVSAHFVVVSYVEIKALSATTGEHKAQVLNYLKATREKLGLLVNFGCYPKATIERFVL